MSTYTAISSVNKTLVSLLWNSIKDDSQVNSIVTSEDEISLSSPKEIAQDKKLSLFLYQIAEFSSMRNIVQPSTDPDKTGYFPVYLALHYLITPNTRNLQSDHILLGKTIQVFSDNAILRGSILQGSLGENNSNLKLVMDSLSIDELSKLWSAIGTDYKLSISYSAAPVIIEPTREKEAKRVVEKKAEYTIMTRKENEHSY
jgi:hypothetical protein